MLRVAFQGAPGGREHPNARNRPPLTSPRLDRRVLNATEGTGRRGPFTLITRHRHIITVKFLDEPADLREAPSRPPLLVEKHERAPLSSYRSSHAHNPISQHVINTLYIIRVREPPRTYLPVLSRTQGLTRNPRIDMADSPSLGLAQQFSKVRVIEKIVRLNSRCAARRPGGRRRQGIARRRGGLRRLL